ncbi:nuclear transport factor 2 family protein [Leucobacter sp. M11]|nr:nuclear transport factor 2 family protein [Leucobacter sp. M11]
MQTPTESRVLEAADAIVQAFAATDTERYFAGFAADASFIFHTDAERLNSRAEYESLWASWLADGWRVRSCVSSNRLVQAFPGGAVFSHDVATEIEVDGERDAYTERETIVFAVTESGALRAVHEHLSPTPDAETEAPA